MKTLSEPPAGASEGDRRRLESLVDKPLASTRDLSLLSGTSQTLVYRRLGELRDRGLVDSAALGWYRPLAHCWFMTGSGLSVAGMPGSTWHEEFARCRLLERLPSVEWFYQVASQVRDLGDFQSFHWMDHGSIDAVVRYRYGWIALFWSGAFQSENSLADRLGRLAPDLREMSVSHEPPWPGLLAFVVSDEWQRELVYRAARRYRLEDQVTVWCARDGTRSGARNSRASRGWVSQPRQHRSTGGWSWEQRLEASPWTERRGMVTGRALDAISQWPGMALKMVRQSIDEGPGGRSAGNACKLLCDYGFTGRLWHRGKYRYMTTSKGVFFISRRDRVHHSHSKDRVDSLSWVAQPQLRAHEDGIMSFMGHFLARGIPVAAGWRSLDQMGLDGSITPDGMVFLERSPYGPTWAYFEYERTARGEARVMRKLGAFGSPSRSDDWPVLLVCWNERAEHNFQEVGRRMGISMLTTTIGRLGRHGPLDNLECWSMYGEPALIG